MKGWAVVALHPTMASRWQINVTESSVDVFRRGALGLQSTRRKTQYRANLSGNLRRNKTDQFSGGINVAKTPRHRGSGGSLHLRDTGCGAKKRIDGNSWAYLHQQSGHPRRPLL